MLIAFIALRSLWQVWYVRRQRRLARRYLQQLTDIDFSDAGEESEGTPFWRAVVLRFRKNASAAEARRARSRKAMLRLARMASAK